MRSSDATACLVERNISSGLDEQAPALDDDEQEGSLSPALTLVEVLMLPRLLMVTSEGLGLTLVGLVLQEKVPMLVFLIS
jgi:hypothetical protein